MNEPVGLPGSLLKWPVDKSLVGLCRVRLQNVQTVGKADLIAPPTQTRDMLPGMQLTTASAFIPILNASLAMRSVLGGTASLIPMAIVYVSLLVLSAGGLLFGAKIVARERTLFRG